MKKIAVGIIGIALIIILIIIFYPNNYAENSTEMDDQLNEITLNDFEAIADSANLIQGNSNSQVRILAFLDYQCLDCRAWFLGTFAEIKEKLLEDGKTNVKFVNAGTIGENSLLAAEAVYCSNDQDKFPEYQEKLFLAQQEIDGPWIDSSQLKTYAQEIDLKIEEFSECLDSNKYQKKAKSNVDESEILGIDRVPVFIIINDEGKSHVIKGGVSFEIFEKTINQMKN